MTFPVLIPRFTYGDLDLTDVPFAVNQEGIDFQSGDLVVSVLSSFLQDGELEVSSGRGNMTLVIPVLIEGSDLLALAEAEALLAIEAQKPTNTFTIDPGDDIAPATVFDTFQAADVAYTYNAAAEQQGFRQFNLTISALPFGGSDFDVTAEAIAIVPGAPVVVNDCSSTAGWSSTTSAVTTSGGAVSASGGPGSQLKLTQSFSAAGTRWISTDWVDAVEVSPGSGGITLSITTAAGETTAALPYRTDPLTTGYQRSYWQVPAGVPDAVLSLAFAVRQYAFGSLTIDQVARVSGPPQGTGRQQARVAPVAGSARTQAGIHVASPTSSLGEVLVYTSAASIMPPLGPLRTSAPPAFADERVSGGYYDLSTAVVFDVPLGLLTPGLHALIALANSSASTPRTISWSTRARINATDIGRTSSGTATATTNAYKFIPLGLVNLPTNGVRPGSSGLQRIEVVDTTSGGTPARLDELYICNLTTGRLSIVSCGTGTPAAGGPSSNLWLDPATVASRTPSIMRGFSPTGSDAFFAGDSIQAAGEHEFVPTSAKIFVVTTNATDAAVTLTHRPRWLGHAALVAP